jgi:hypothetical protein
MTITVGGETWPKEEKSKDSKETVNTFKLAEKKEETKSDLEALSMSIIQKITGAPKGFISQKEGYLKLSPADEAELALLGN